MTIIPKSIVARTAWVLGLGFVIMIIDTVIISTLFIKAESNSANYMELGMRIKTVTQILSNSPPAIRQIILENYNDPDLVIGLNKIDDPQFKTSTDWGTKGMQAHLMKYLSNTTIRHVSVAHPFRLESQIPDTSRYHIEIILDDNSKLVFKTDVPNRHRMWYLSIAASLIIFVVSIYILALLVSRQIIKPLKQFSDAAMRFGVDLDAAPLSDSGPTEINAAVSAFNTMQERIRSFVTERMQIIAAISHDLRTPLTRLRLRFESMEEKEQVQKALNDINEMQMMLDSTLAFARDDAAKEEKTKVDLTSLIQSICDDTVDTGAKISCDLQPSLEFTCKPVAIRRAITNLLDNAIKYGKEANITLSNNDQHVKISISDQGPGIPIEERENVFSPFYRIEKSRNRDTGGTGLGLTVARTIIRAHGGEIELDRGDSGGLIVNITLPR